MLIDQPAPALPRTFGGKTLKGKRITIRPATPEEMERRRHWSVGFRLVPPNVSKKDEDQGAFKTPTLREVEHHFPYMHDGSISTLEEVVEHYDKGGIKNAYLNKRMEPLKLTPQDKSDLVAFLKALSGEGWQQIREPRADEFPK